MENFLLPAAHLKPNAGFSNLKPQSPLSCKDADGLDAYMGFESLPSHSHPGPSAMSSPTAISSECNSMTQAWLARL